jgi:hypothetical protein
MYAQWFAGSDLLVWPLIGLGIFFVTFVAVLIWIFVGMRDTRRTGALAAMPLRDDDRDFPGRAR